jgi:hypothetical protein
VKVRENEIRSLENDKMLACIKTDLINIKNTVSDTNDTLKLMRKEQGRL